MDRPAVNYSWINTVIVLLAVCVAVFIESAWTLPRWLLGAQVDLLPVLVVYAALMIGPMTTALVALLGGLWFDALSSNPLGISVLPLAAIGWLVVQGKTNLLHDQSFAQMVIGLAASAASPLLSVLILQTIGEEPSLGWNSFWQWTIMAAGGGLLTPVCFRTLNALQSAVTYQVRPDPTFRSDREIKRGRYTAC